MSVMQQPLGNAVASGTTKSADQCVPVTNVIDALKDAIEWVEYLFPEGFDDEEHRQSSELRLRSLKEALANPSLFAPRPLASIICSLKIRHSELQEVAGTRVGQIEVGKFDAVATGNDEFDALSMDEIESLINTLEGQSATKAVSISTRRAREALPRHS
jgi:hypothetical protein